MTQILLAHSSLNHLNGSAGEKKEFLHVAGVWASVRVHLGAGIGWYKGGSKDWPMTWKKRRVPEENE